MRFSKDKPQDSGVPVPQTISDKKWGHLRDSLPFPAEPAGLSHDDTMRRIKFSHQRTRSDQS
jgi:hypothetical protein